MGLVFFSFLFLSNPPPVWLSLPEPGSFNSNQRSKRDSVFLHRNRSSFTSADRPSLIGFLGIQSTDTRAKKLHNWDTITLITHDQSRTLFSGQTSFVGVYWVFMTLVWTWTSISDLIPHSSETRSGFGPPGPLHSLTGDGYKKSLTSQPVWMTTVNVSPQPDSAF